MKEVRIEKLTLNFGAGNDQARLEKGVILLKMITGIDPVRTITNKRIPAWGVRPGLPIGCMITLRKKQARELLIRLLKAKENKLATSCFDNLGNVSFGLKEYIDVPGVKYDPKIGVLGFQACITLERKGFRVKHKRIRPAKIGKEHIITQSQAIEFMTKEFEVTVQ